MGCCATNSGHQSMPVCFYGEPSRTAATCAGKPSGLICGVIAGKSSVVRLSVVRRQAVGRQSCKSGPPADKVGDKHGTGYDCHSLSANKCSAHIQQYVEEQEKHDCQKQAESTPRSRTPHRHQRQLPEAGFETRENNKRHRNDSDDLQHHDGCNLPGGRLHTRLIHATCHHAQQCECESGSSGHCEGYADVTDAGNRRVFGALLHRVNLSLQEKVPFLFGLKRQVIRVPVAAGFFFLNIHEGLQ